MFPWCSRLILKQKGRRVAVPAVHEADEELQFSSPQTAPCLNEDAPEIQGSPDEPFQEQGTPAGPAMSDEDMDFDEDTDSDNNSECDPVLGLHTDKDAIQLLDRLSSGLHAFISSQTKRTQPGRYQTLSLKQNWPIQTIKHQKLKEHRVTVSLRTPGYQDIQLFFQPIEKKRTPIPITVSDDEDNSTRDVSLTHMPMGTLEAIPFYSKDLSVPNIQDNSILLETTLNSEQSHWFDVIMGDDGTHTTAPVEEEEELSGEELNIMDEHNSDALLTYFPAVASSNNQCLPQDSSIQPRM